MKMKPYLLMMLVLLGAGERVDAQVIEIDSGGNAQVYDGPTQFIGGEIAPIGVKRSPVAANSLDIDRSISEASKAQGIDHTLLRAVAMQESGGRAAAVSSKGARGVMQLMPATAAQLGVKIDDVADNVRGGALYLRQQIDRFGSVPLALAAYNAGPAAVVRFRGIPPYRETRDYVSRIMARWKPVSSIRQAADSSAARANPDVIEVPAL